ncbi:MAG: signal peptidase I [Lachnospiraceae bacterium]|nr:signal peptidase I [Lachnospiraceae bacterium]
MAEKNLRKMNRKELIEIIYALQQDEKESGGENTVPIPSEAAVDAERERLQYQKKYLQTLRTTIYALIIVAAATILLATMFLPVLQVSGTSMEPTLSDGDITVLVKNADFETGDLVGFYYQNKLLLKRVIGGPGDIIDIDSEGNVYVNDELIDEPYITEKSPGETDITYPYQVPENRYFVMGDNRSVSIDSRSSTIGCIEVDQIVGKVIIRVWPLNRISLIE